MDNQPLAVSNAVVSPGSPHPAGVSIISLFEMWGDAVLFPKQGPKTGYNGAQEKL
jgi:hypothetical protein